MRGGFGYTLEIDWELVYPGDYILRSVLYQEEELLDMRTKYREFDAMFRKVKELVDEKDARNGEAAEEARVASFYGGGR